MSQETNLNVAPYYDDFNPAKDYYKVLFKPGQPVQARELTGLQSMLQNQVSSFGQHMFKEGANVIPGQLSYFSNFYCIQVEDNFLGVPISLYQDQLVGQVLIGEDSGVQAEVKKVIKESESDKGNITLYVSYIKSGTTDNQSITFFDSENLLAKTTISYSNTSIGVNQGVVRTITENASQIGSAMGITEGVYYLRGYFVRVDEQLIILDQYGTFPTYRVGLEVSESIVNSDIDADLVDNAAGFPNFSAPGADRLEIKAYFAKKSVNDTDDVGFVELARVQDGQLKLFTQRTDYNIFAEELARRTYDESGDYYISPFRINVRESLNSNQGNTGLYQSTETTSDGYVPSEGLMVYDISPGKAYIRGFEVDKLENTLVDISKPRTTDGVRENIALAFGDQVKVNRVFASPGVGIVTTAYVTLQDTRVGASHSLSSGQTVGVARVYDFNSEEEYVDSSSQFSLRLFDTQYYTQVQVNENFPSLAKSSLIEGQSSSASGYLISALSNNKELTIGQVKGKFLPGERITVNGVNDSRIVAFTTSFGSDNVKSVHQAVGTGKTFNCDVVLSDRKEFGKPVTITAHHAGISTITSTKGTFIGISTANAVVVYNRTGIHTECFAKVSTINSDGSAVTLTGVTTVTGVCEGGLPTSATEVSNLQVGVARVTSHNENRLLAPLNYPNVDSVNLRDSSVTIRKQYDGLSVAASQLTSPAPEANFNYTGFDEERYAITYQDGSVETLTSDQFALDSSTGLITFSGLTKVTATPVVLTTTQINQNVTQKEKRNQRAGILTINRSKYAESGSSATGVGVKQDGLTYNTVYGTRIHDREICLNTADVTRVLGVFESFDTADAALPTLTLTSILSPSSSANDYIIGEKITGSTSRACATIIKKASSTTINFVYANDQKFVAGEIITSDESAIEASITQVDTGANDVTNYFLFDNGQRGEYYDYARVIRKDGVAEPSRRLTFVYQAEYVETSDTGDIFTSNSYSRQSYKKDVAKFDGRRVSDFIDIRPRVADYNTSSTDSPFDFDSRSFAVTSTSPTNIIVSDENLLLDYSYFLGRIDRIFMGKNGVVQVSKGAPSLNPRVPPKIDNALDVATAILPPYVYDVADIKFKRTQHRRYTMKDIGRLETRLSNLEYYTALSLLENETANLQIKDTNGLERYKNGFLVDNFGDHKAQNTYALDSRCSIDTFNNELRPPHYTTALDLQLSSPSLGETLYDDENIYNMNDPNTQKTGDLITLNYSTVEYFKNPYATRVEGVTPFLITQFIGTVELNPSSDVWIDVKILETHNTNLEGDYAATIARLGIDEQTGLGPIQWGIWEEIVTGRTQHDPQTVTETKSGIAPGSSLLADGNNYVANSGSYTQTTTSTKVDEQGSKSRTGVADKVSVKLDTVITNEILINTEIISYMRSRNIEFIGKSLRPNTVMHIFFDKKEMTRWCTPKLLEITMTSGAFFPGETVEGFVAGDGTTALINPSANGGDQAIRFRLAKLNHKSGNFLDPATTYAMNPYDTSQELADTYASTSTFLNLDTASLSKAGMSDFYGKAIVGMTLKGLSSGSEATVKDIRLITDENGQITGTMFVPTPTGTGNPAFTTGIKTFVVTSDPYGLNPPSSLVSKATTNFEAAGTLHNKDRYQNLIRNAEITQKSYEETNDFARTFDTDVQSTYEQIDQPTVVKPKPNTSGCSSRNIAVAVAQHLGYSSYTAYHRDVQHSAYDLNFLLQQPGAENCQGASYNRGRRSRGGGRGRSNSGRRDIRSLAVSVASANGYRSYTAFHNAVSHNAYDRGFLSNYAGGRGSSGSRGRGRSGGRYSYSGRSRNQGGSRTSNARAMAEQVASAAGYRSYTSYHRSNPHQAYDTNYLKAKCGYTGSDPLAQSFIVEEENGVTLTHIDVFFAHKDDNGIPVRCEIRNLDQGIPGKLILPFSSVTLDPGNVEISQDATIPTSFTFPSPVYLEPDKEYAFVLLSNSTKYGVWISRMGETDQTGTLTNSASSPNTNQTIVSQQPLLGSLFKSQNASTWTPSQLEDLKMTVYKAEFVTNTPALVDFVSPVLALGNDQIINLRNNPIETFSKKATVGLGSTFSASYASIISAGTSISQGNSDATGIVAEINGSVLSGTSGVSIVNSGVGYTPSSGSYAYTGIALTTVTGDGSGAKATIGVVAGSISTVTITDGGTNYSVGDVVGIASIGNNNLGKGSRISVGILSAFESLVLDQVQGTFTTGAGSTLSYEVTAGIGSTIVGNSVASLTVDTLHNGTQFKVNHRNHSMHSTKNYVVVENVQSDKAPTNILVDMTQVSTTNLTVTNATEFKTFENVSVATSNPGYASIDGEIISYTGVTGNVLTGISSRGVDASRITSHPSGSKIYKYEVSGVSLRRINKTHYLYSPAATSTRPITLDDYVINVGMNTSGVNRTSASTMPELFFNERRVTGGKNVTASQNIQYETITPNIQTVVPKDTILKAKLRSISGQSIDGTEVDFTDLGYVGITLGEPNTLLAPRLVGSRVNENAWNGNLPDKRSMTIQLQLETLDPNISPMIDTDRISAILTSNRVNNPVNNFASDGSVNKVSGDPHSAIYVSKKIILENPSTAIKTLMAINKPDQSDVRVLYRTYDGDDFNIENTYTLFPGYGNVDAYGVTVNPVNNNGTSNTLIPSTKNDEFRDHEFYVSNLRPFTAFDIKIIMTSTNQATPPRIKDFRSIALA